MLERFTALALLTMTSFHAMAQPTSRQDFKPVDSWFAYGAATISGGPRRWTADIAAHGATDVSFGSVAEEIVVIGERQKRDFALVRPGDELTGLRGLEAAQPVVPWPGTTCSYKDLCYDLSQPPLRASLPRLAAALFGD